MWTPAYDLALCDPPANEGYWCLHCHSIPIADLSEQEREISGEQSIALGRRGLSMNKLDIRNSLSRSICVAIIRFAREESSHNRHCLPSTESPSFVQCASTSSGLYLDGYHQTLLLSIISSRRLLVETKGDMNLTFSRRSSLRANVPGDRFLLCSHCETSLNKLVSFAWKPIRPHLSQLPERLTTI